MSTFYIMRSLGIKWDYICVTELWQLQNTLTALYYWNNNEPWKRTRKRERLVLEPPFLVKILLTKEREPEAESLALSNNEVKTWAHLCPTGICYNQTESYVLGESKKYNRYLKRSFQTSVSTVTQGRGEKPYYTMTLQTHTAQSIWSGFCWQSLKY